jgi:general secretion pathway protein K
MMGGSGAKQCGRGLKGFFRAALANEKGVALMIVLWVMAILMIIVTEFVYTMKVDSAAAGNFKDEAAASYLASAGVNASLAVISNEYDLVCAGTGGGLVFKKRENGVLRDIEMKSVFELGGGQVSYSIEDESGKININSASRETLVELLRTTGVDTAERDMIADSILDWIDPDDEHYLNGAETDYYSSLSHPYKAKNGPVDTIEELLLVRGMTPEIFYGTGFVPPELENDGRGESREYGGIYRSITVKGDGKLNINTASEAVLEAVYGKGRAQEIMLRRSTEGFFETPVYGGAVSSDTFLIRSRGEVRGVRAGVLAVVERKGGEGVDVSYWKEEGVTPD